MQNLPSLNRSFYHSSSKDNLTLHDILIRNRKFCIEFLIILELACRGEKIQEAAQKIKIFEGHIRDQKDGKNILRRCYPLNYLMSTEKRTACSISFTTQGVLSGQNFFSYSLILRIASIYSSFPI